METDKEQLWQIFAQTGRVQDYLRYADAVNAVIPPKKETTDGTQSKGNDRQGE
ncbi:MAG: hypothetical protein IKV35_03195 [Clostridia bacterium]|nr:hypothetical protein [Clostridia bacterium]